jgi:hypothetical protein
LEACTVSRNFCGSGGDMGYGFGGTGGTGGGFCNAGVLAMKDCTVNGNASGRGGTPVGQGGGGGGIYNTGRLMLDNCTISGNVAGSGSGGVLGLGGLAGTGGAGGGIHNLGSFLLSCCTISGNSAGQGGPGAESYAIAIPDGGGIYNDTNALSAVLRDTLAALNFTGPGGLAGTGIGVVSNGCPFRECFGPVTNGLPGLPGIDPDLSGAFQSQGFNLVGAGNGSTGLTNGLNADQVGTSAAPINPLIGPLQMNGGPTATHALLPGSPAIDQAAKSRLHSQCSGWRWQRYRRIRTGPSRGRLSSTPARRS